MGIDYIRDYYKVPAKRGGRVRDEKGREGTITGARGPYVSVRLDDQHHVVYYHPNSLTYLES